MASTITLKIISFNIACSDRDEQRMPLADRIEAIAKWIAHLQPDVLILLESGRSSGEIHWEQMARSIEKASSELEYMGCKYTNSSPNSFAKSIFINPRTVRVMDIRQIWISDKLNADIVSVDIVPIGIKMESISIAGIHVEPLDRDTRIMYYQRLASEFYHLAMGDYDEDSEIMNILSSYRELLPMDTKFTVQSFPFDVITIPESGLIHHPFSEIINRSDGWVTLRPKSWLDHALIHREAKFTARAEIAPEFDYVCSDHAPIITYLTL